MVSKLDSSVEDRGMEHRLSQTNTYKIGIYCFAGKLAALRRKCKDFCFRIRIIFVSKWGDMSTSGMLFQWASSTVCMWWSSKYKVDIISLNVTCSHPDIAEKSVTHKRPHLQWKRCLIIWKVTSLVGYNLVVFYCLCGCDRMVVGFTTIYTISAITTDVVSSNLDQGEVYNIMW